MDPRPPLEDRPRSGFVRADRADDHVTVVNETDLPDAAVEDAVADYWVENASVGGAGRASSFGTWVGEGGGSLLARNRFTVPTNLVEEIKLSRDLSERDDDVAATIGQAQAIAFSEDHQWLHKDEKTISIFEQVERRDSMNLRRVLNEFYREWLIAGQFTSFQLPVREMIEFEIGEDTEEPQKTQMNTPRVGVLPSEQIRVFGDDSLGLADLHYIPCDSSQERWLKEWFNPRTSPGRKLEMRKQNPVWAAIFVAQVNVPMADRDLFGDIGSGNVAYTLNRRMVKRTTMPKGSWRYPRPPMTRNFALLEAKRLLNIMDFALLQGGTNYIVIVRKGTDQRPAQPQEIQGLYQTVRTASRTGVLVGDHRLSVEIVTPDLTALLNAEKRALIGRKLAMALLRVTDHAVLDPGVEGERSDMEIKSRVVTHDRKAIVEHVEAIAQDVVDRNPSTFTKTSESPKLWFPKIVLAGLDQFNQLILKLLDRGAIPRKWAVQAAGFDWDASVEQRKREIAHGDDETMVPPVDPNSVDQGGDAGPQDNGPGRPPGSGPNNGQPNAKPSNGPSTRPGKRTIRRTPGETIKAWYDEDEGEVIRVGDLTYGILEEFSDRRSIGRVTSIEREALGGAEAIVKGGVAVVPVNSGYDTTGEQAVRLKEGVSMIVGHRKSDGALVAKALCFREPEYDLTQAENHAIRWGFQVPVAQAEEEAEE